MNIYKSSLFKYIAGDSLKGKSVPMTIDRVVNEDVSNSDGKEEKQVIYFKESKKGMILNKTNAKRIARLYGPETDDWKGVVIELYTESVKAFGETHNALRVREAKQQAQANKIKAETLTTEERKARRADNPLRIAPRGPEMALEGAPIGESGFNPDWEVFVARVTEAIPFFSNEAQVKAALDLMELTYSPENEELCFTELYQSAGREADLKAA
jgi:hypothetical protein